MDITRRVALAGGLIPTNQLLRSGYSERQLTESVRHGVLIRVRQGWYCLPDTTAIWMEAVRVGGRMSCVTGAAHHQLWVRPSMKLHVAVPITGSRLRSPIDRTVRLSTLENHRVRVHWTDRRAPGTRFAQSPLHCVLSMTHCQSPELVVAAADSAIREGHFTRAAWVRAIAKLPRRLRKLLARVDPTSESIIESVVRFRLAALGIALRTQVSIAGVGKVDLLVGDRLVIELDGWEFHQTRAAFEEDRRRDFTLNSRGYIVLRFTYRHVFQNWAKVKGSILASIARNDHRFPVAN